VECLSTIGPSSAHSRTAPESRIARVSATVSRSLMPLKKTAMASAAAWPSLTAPDVRPEMNSAISPSPSAAPSRFLRRIAGTSMPLPPSLAFGQRKRCRQEVADAESLTGASGIDHVYRRVGSGEFGDPLATAAAGRGEPAGDTLGGDGDGRNPAVRT